MQANKFTSLLGLFAMLSIISCNNDNDTVARVSKPVVVHNSEKLPANQLIQWVEDEQNQLKKRKKIQDIEFIIQYMPVDYLVSKEGFQNLSDSSLNNNRVQHDDLVYFSLKILKMDHQGELLKYNLASVSDYKARVDYYSFSFKDDVFLIKDTDTVPCEMLHFERSFDAVPYCSFMIAFSKEKIDNNKDYTLVIDDKVFNKGLIKFQFAAQTFIAAPKLAS